MPVRVTLAVALTFKWVVPAVTEDSGKSFWLADQVTEDSTQVMAPPPPPPVPPGVRMMSVSSSAAKATGQTVPAGGSGQPSGTSACSVEEPEKPSSAGAQLPVARSTSASAKDSKIPAETGAP